MSKTSTIALLLSTAVVLTASAQLQPLSSGPPPFQRGMLGIGVDPLPVPKPVLIQKPAVQDELELTKAQRKRLEEIQKEQRRAEDRLAQNYQESLRGLGDQADIEAKKAVSRPMVSAREALHTQADAALLKALEPRQRDRLDQIQLQAEGPLAFSRPEVLERLNLSPEQFEMIQEIVAQGRKQLMETSAVPPGVQPGDGPLTPERYRALSESKQFKSEVEKSRKTTLKARDATMQAIAKVLTKGQRATYRKMLGEPFDLTRLQGDGGVPANVAPSAKPKAAPC